MVAVLVMEKFLDRLADGSNVLKPDLEFLTRSHLTQ
jgi:hypothetical protein